MYQKCEMYIKYLRFFCLRFTYPPIKIKTPLFFKVFTMMCRWQVIRHSPSTVSHIFYKKIKATLDNFQSLFSFISLGSEGVYFVPAFNGLQVKLYCNVTSLKYLICILSEAWCYMLLILSLFSTIRVSPSCQSGNTFKFFNVKNLQFPRCNYSYRFYFARIAHIEY